MPTPTVGQIESIKRKLALKGNKSIIYTGTFAPYQGLDMLIDSAELVVTQIPNTMFLMVGG